MSLDQQIIRALSAIADVAAKLDIYQRASGVRINQGGASLWL